MNRLEFTDDASGGHFTEAESLDEYVAEALDSPSSYNQGEEGVSTLVRVMYREDGEIRAGWIDFAKDVDVPEALRILRKHPDGMDIDWTHDAGGIVASPTLDADSTDVDVRREVLKAIRDSGRSPDEIGDEYHDAVEHWTEAVDAARKQRELVSEATDLLEDAAMTTYGQHRDAPAEWDSGKLHEARELVEQIADLENEFGDSPTYGPALSALDPDDAVPAKAPTAAELARETLRAQPLSRSR